MIGSGVWGGVGLAGHELSMPNADLVGPVRGLWPRSNISTRIIRPPQQGQVIAGVAGSVSGLVSVAGAGAGASSKARALARVAARVLLANRP